MLASKGPEGPLSSPDKSQVSKIFVSDLTLDSIIVGRSKRHSKFNPLNPELNLICCLLALLPRHFLHVSRIRVKSLTLRQLMSYTYGAPILDVSRSHTTTHHSQ